MKFDVGKVFDAARARATQAGQQLSDVIDHLATLTEKTASSLRNGLTFGDNFNCSVRVVELIHDTEQVVATSSREVLGIIPIRVETPTAGLDSFLWYKNPKGQLVARAKFVGAPTEALRVTIVILNA